MNFDMDHLMDNNYLSDITKSGGALSEEDPYQFEENQ